MMRRPYRITIDTDDPSLFDLLPAHPEFANYEATMTRYTTDGKVEDTWHKTGTAPRSSVRDNDGFSMQAVEPEHPELWPEGP